MLTTKIPIGHLDRRITIQSPVVTTGDDNQDEINSWTDLDDVWAKISDRQGTETLDADRVNYEKQTVFTIRYRSDVTVMMRIVFGGFAHQIVSITENGMSRKGFLDIVTEIVDNEVVT
jgi:SPP1 family predicted phage head-tail adaptor